MIVLLAGYALKQIYELEVRRVSVSCQWAIQYLIFSGVTIALLGRVGVKIKERVSRFSRWIEEDPMSN
jgi:hypothetical protein